MSELTIEGLDIPSGIGDIKIDEDLLKEADELDTGGETASGESKALSILDDDDEDLAGELIVDGIELGLQIFGHEKYEISEGKRALLEGAYGKLAGKYGQKAPAGLGRYKEEVVVIILTLIVVGGGYRSIKALKQEDANKALEDKGGERGHKSK